MPAINARPIERRPTVRRCAYCDDTLNKEDVRLFHRFCGPRCKRRFLGQHGRPPRATERARAARRLVQEA